MTRDAMDLQPTDDMDLLVEVSDQALEAACGGLMQGSPAEHAAPYRGAFWQHRNAYDGNGEYEFPTARHYVPQLVRLSHVETPTQDRVGGLELELRLVPEPGDQDVKTPEAALIAKTDAAHLRAAIAALPTPFRETLVLRDIGGLDYREIAEATEAPIGAVMSRLARARGRLIATIRTGEQ